MLRVKAPRALMFLLVLCRSPMLRATMSLAQMPPQAMFITSTVSSSLYVAIMSTGMG